MAWIPAAVAGGAALLGALDQNSSNKGIAEDNRTFQANMSNTSYQRAVKDMQAAGLNPMLAYSQGGASTPAGSTATMVNAVGEGVNSGFAAYSRGKEAELIDANIKKVQADTEVSRTQAAVLSETIPKLRAEVHQSTASAAALNQSVDKMRSEIANLNAQLRNIPKLGAQIDAVTAEVSSRIPVNAASYDRILAETKKVLAETTNVKLTSKTIQETTEKIILENKLRALEYTLGVNADLPHSQAMGKYWRGEWGKEVAPYLSDVGKITGSAADIANMFRFGGVFGGKPKYPPYWRE